MYGSGWNLAWKEGDREREEASDSGRYTRKVSGRKEGCRLRHLALISDRKWRTKKVGRIELSERGRVGKVKEGGGMVSEYTETISERNIT